MSSFSSEHKQKDGRGTNCFTGINFSPPHIWLSFQCEWSWDINWSRVYWSQFLMTRSICQSGAGQTAGDRAVNCSCCQVCTLERWLVLPVRPEGSQWSPPCLWPCREHFVPSHAVMCGDGALSPMSSQRITSSFILSEDNHLLCDAQSRSPI